MNPYIHDEYVHNLDSPNEIVGVLVALFQPASVIDVGCGIGTFVHCFKNRGVPLVNGMDGSWVNRNLLEKYMSPDDFIEVDLSKPLNPGKKYDLLISLEVAEHLPENASDTFIDNVTSLSDQIVFSAAIPGQMGQKHINLQWHDFWEKKFNERDYVVYDLLRPIFWNNNKIFYWYRQNIMVAIKRGTQFNPDNFKNYYQKDIMNIVHPELYLKYVERLNSIYSGKEKIKVYFNLLLTSLKNKFK